MESGLFFTATVPASKWSNYWRRLWVICWGITQRGASLVAQMVKTLPARHVDLGWVPRSGWSPGERNGYPLLIFLPGEFHAWTEEPGGLQSMGSQRVGHNWAANTVTHFTQRDLCFLLVATLGDLSEELNKMNSGWQELEVDVWCICSEFTAFYFYKENHHFGSQYVFKILHKIFQIIEFWSSSFSSSFLINL